MTTSDFDHKEKALLYIGQDVTMYGGTPATLESLYIDRTAIDAWVDKETDMLLIKIRVKHPSGRGKRGVIIQVDPSTLYDIGEGESYPRCMVRTGVRREDDPDRNY